jgi:hypothetical protein
MNTKIEHVCGEVSQTIYDIIIANEDIYGVLEPNYILNTDFYCVYNDTELCAFFGLCRHDREYETQISYVYVFEKYRKQGIFNKIIKYVKKNESNAKIIVIGATYKNDLANKIYKTKFKECGTCEEGTWYMVCERHT